MSLFSMRTTFSYPEFKKTVQEEWELDIINIFRCFDTEREGVIPRDLAIHAFSLLGMNGEDHFTKKDVPIHTFIDAVRDERERNSFDNIRRWKYIFSLIAGPNNDTITTKSLRNFFSMFGHKPEARFCDDFIDEFDRTNLKKTEITLDDWLMFCRIHRFPF